MTTTTADGWVEQRANDTIALYGYESALARAVAKAEAWERDGRIGARVEAARYRAIAAEIERQRAEYEEDES